MRESLSKTGILTREDLGESPGVPSEERMAKGPVAYIECMEEIPCNPCEFVCPNGAISVGKEIIDLPVLDENKCDGCGLCIPVCPGLAIFIVDKSYSEEEALIGFPYELLPLPEVGMNVYGVDRKGKAICKARVVKVQNPKRFDRTPVVYMAIPKAFALDVRNLRFMEGEE